MRSINLKVAKYFLVLTLYSCANIIMPPGGEKDTQAPKIVKTSIIKDEKNTTIQIDFDEYIQINNWEKNFYISPPLKIKVQKNIKSKSLFIKIEDTLCKQSTYSICLNSCIKDNNEGNILTEYFYNFSLDSLLDTFSIGGFLQEAYTLDSIESAAILLYDLDINDSLIYKIPPNFITKTDKNGYFHFSNLDSKTYKVFAHQDFEYKYSNNKKIAFLNHTISAKKDSLVMLYAFEPILQNDIITDSISTFKKDTTNKAIKDSTHFLEQNYGNLELIIDEINPCIIQLVSNNQVIKELNFSTGPYIIKDIPPANYRIKYIYDINNDGKWNTGKMEERVLPEKVTYYPNEVNIRANWDLVLDWSIL
tara:strand:+ start:13727 stop:14815 length:1089 start_codon:yes stop_codon:yes gene_type:complete